MLIKNQNIHINADVIGNGEPLVMLHPNGHCIKDWYELGYVDALKDKYQLILVDSRGFGSSDKPHDAEQYQASMIASDTIAILDHLGIQQAKCFGYSMGGRHAFALMQYYPDRFESFVIGGSHPYTTNKLLKSYTLLLQQGLPKVVEMFEKTFGSFPPGVRENFLRNDLEALIAINSHPLIDYTDVLHRYQGDVSFVIGDKDPVLPLVVQAHEFKTNSKIAVVGMMDHMQMFFAGDKMSEFI